MAKDTITESELPVACPHWSPGRITMRTGCTACAAVLEFGGIMSDRTLTRANDAHPEILEDGELHNVGMWEEVTIERSAAGQPGLLFIITRYENSMVYDQMCVTVPDGNAFLAPVIAWLKGDPHSEYWRAAHRINEHFAAHMAVARADENESQYRGSQALARDLRVLIGQESS